MSSSLRIMEMPAIFIFPTSPAKSLFKSTAILNAVADSPIMSCCRFNAHVLPALKQSQRRAAGRSNPAARFGTDSRRRRQRQDTRTHDADRLVAGYGPGQPFVGARGDLPQQGRQGTARAPL